MSNREQHDPMEQRLWERMNRARPAQAGPCPDPLLLAVYVDGTATDAEVQRIDGHLAACPACLAAVGEIRGLLAAPLMLAPKPVLERAKALVPAPHITATHTRWSAIGRWAAAAAAAVIVGYLGFVAGHATWLNREALADTLVCETSFGLADDCRQESLEDDFLSALKEIEQ
jgi:predicted anti-sigma-YlaC factor YlaD